MLRNKIGKPSQTATNTQGSKTTETKPSTTSISNPTGIKTPLGIGSGIGAGGIKPPVMIGVKPQTKPPVNNLTATQSQGPIPTLSKTQTSQTPQPTLTKQQQKPPAIRPQQIKTEQQRLAELVTKKAGNFLIQISAEMKKDYQMINKVSSQVGSEKKSYFKEYEAKFSHVLKASKKVSKKDKENVCKLEKQTIQSETKQLQSKKSEILWHLNEWDILNQLKQYMLVNFKSDKYM